MPEYPRAVGSKNLTQYNRVEYGQGRCIVAPEAMSCLTSQVPLGKVSLLTGSS
jgi:hypothetical protein